MLKGTIYRLWYEYLSYLAPDHDIPFLNYGYAPLDAQDPLTLNKMDEEHRYAIQLYDHVVSAVDVSGMDVLEIGCGRGGGASYIQRYLNPRSVTAVDISVRAIAFCNAHYDLPGLRFMCGNAEALDIKNRAFDVILSVESSHAYSSPKRFFKEAHRLLKPQGHFLLADFRHRNIARRMAADLESLGFELLRQEEIRSNVVRALELDSARREAVVERYSPWMARFLIRWFAGIQGTPTSYRNLKTGNWEYVCFVMQK